MLSLGEIVQMRICDVINRPVRFRNPKTKRVKKGEIVYIHLNHAGVQDRDRVLYKVRWEDVEFLYGK